MGEAEAPAIHDNRTITITQDLAFKILDALNLASLYSLLGSEYQHELGFDFKPEKFVGFEKEQADKENAAYLELLKQMQGQVKPPS